MITPGATDEGERNEDEILDAVVTGGRSRKATITIAVVGGIATLALAVLAWTWIIDWFGGDAVTRYVQGHGPTYEGDGFHARFPTTPGRVVASPRTPNSRVIVTSTPRPNLRFSVTAAEAPTDAANDPVTALNAAAAELVLNSKGRFVRQEDPGVYGPAASKNFTYRVGTTLFRSSMLLTVSRLYTTQVSGTEPTAAQFAALTHSFGLSALG